MDKSLYPDLILHHGRITTLDPQHPEATHLAVKDGRIIGVDDAGEYQRGPETKVIDLQGRRVIPGLNDSHLHVIRGGLNYNMELRWDGVPSLADALRMLKEQARRTPPGQWVRVIGGWTEFQFAERRMPTLAEINAAAPETPVFILHLYCRALLNQAALRACGYTKDTPNPPGGEIQHDHEGNPTGLLIARPNAAILYATLAKGPKLPPEHQMNSTRHFMRELNRLGLTSAIDAGGGFQNYPEDYAVIEELHKRGEMTVRLAYNLFTQKPKQEKADFARWIKMTGPGKGDDFFRCNGAGEMLVFSAADFEDFLEPRPELPATLEGDLKEVVTLLACTIRIASEAAKFGQPEVKLGILPGGGGTQRLPRLVGKGRALQLILTGEMISAQEAYRIGLVNEVVPAANVIARAEAILKQIFSNGPVAVKYSLAAVNKGLEASQAEGLSLEASFFGLCSGTEDKKEGTSAFLEKRAAKFQGR